MKVIFDENVPAPLRELLPRHTVTTVQEQGWAGLTNGELLRQVDGKYDVLVLADKNLRYQQNLAPRRIALVEPADQSLAGAAADRGSDRQGGSPRETGQFHGA